MKKSILAVILLLFTAPIWASNYCNHGCNEYDDEQSSGDATASAEASANVDVTINNVTETVENDNSVNYYNDADDIIESTEFGKVIASMTAMANIPALQHVSAEHNHNGVGVGVGSYNDEMAMALAYLHQYDVFSFKASVAKSQSADAMVGAGTTISW